MVPPETQSGANSANGPMNGSFLVLNLGTNTVSLGNSFQFPLPQKTSQGPSNRSTASNSDTSTSNSNSTDEGSSIPNARKRKGVSNDDPDWVPEKKGRKSSGPACRAARPKTSTSASNKPTGSSLGNGSGTFLMSNDSSVISSSNGNGMPISKLGPPPQYLVSLLSYFGWRVLYRHAFGDFVYVSPAGLPYMSLPKAFEIFLQGTSKCKQKAGGVSRCLESIGLNGGSVTAAAASGSNSALQEGAASGENSKKVSGTSKMSSEPLRLRQHPVSGNHGVLLQMPGMVIPQGKSDDVSSCTTDVKTKSHVGNGCLDDRHKQMACGNSSHVEHGQVDSNNMEKDGRLFGIRRSERLSGRRVLVESEMDIARASSNCSFMSECAHSLNAWGNKENQMSTTSQAEETLGKTSAASTGASLNNEVNNLNFGSMGVFKNAQGNGISIFKDSKLAGVRKSRQINGKNELLGQEVNAEIRVANSSSALSESAANISARQDGNKPDSILDRKTYSCMNGKVVSCELKSSDCSTLDSLAITQTNANDMQQCGIRRSMRINGKHVCVDDEMDLNLVADDSSVDVSECTTNNVGKKEKNQLRTSLFEVGNMECRHPAPVDRVRKQTTAEQSECHKEKILMQMESDQFGKTDKEKQLRSVKFPSLTKDIGIEFPISDKSSVPSAARRKLYGGEKSNGKRRKKRNGGCGLIIRGNEKHGQHEETSSQTKVSILSWLIDSGSLSENEKVVYIRKNRTGNLFSGLVTRGGVSCNCCKKVVPLLEFEAHAGSSLQQPWDNILCLSGKSLMQCLREAWEKEKKQRNIGFRTVGIDDPDPSDDTCGVCADGGHLICCDSCPSTFHRECVMLKDLPEGSWYCPYCRCAYCKHKSDATNETTKLLACKQCGCKYHRECAWKNETCRMDSVPVLFCEKSCMQLASQLSDLLGSANPIEDGYSWTLLKHLDEDEDISSDKRRSLIAKSNAKLSLAFSVLNECFVPLIDKRTGVDMICQAVYNCGSNFKRLNYEGFYTVTLEKDEEIITVASLRFHGTRLAEMPFIGTRPMYRKQGMCRRLLKAIEDMLSSLCILKLIIPAIPDLLETWTTSFSFKPLEPSHKDEIRNLSLMIFAETTLLQKPIFSTGYMEQEDGTRFTVSPSHDKGLHKTNELSSPFGGQINSGGCDTASQDWLSHHVSIKGSWTSPEPSAPCRMHDDSSFTSDLFAIMHPEVSNRSVAGALPARNTSMQNMDLQSDQETSIMGSEIFSTEDLIEDAIRCGFPIDSLFRVRS